MFANAASGLASVVSIPLAHSNFSHMDGWGAGWWIMMLVGMVLFWSLIAVCVVWVVRGLRAVREPVQGDRNPLAILDRRLAEGEISPEEYEERRRILSGRSPNE